MTQEQDQLYGTGCYHALQGKELTEEQLSNVAYSTYIQGYIDKKIEIYLNDKRSLELLKNLRDRYSNIEYARLTLDDKISQLINKI